MQQRIYNLGQKIKYVTIFLAALILLMPQITLAQVATGHSEQTPHCRTIISTREEPVISVDGSPTGATEQISFTSRQCYTDLAQCEAAAGGVGKCVTATRDPGFISTVGGVIDRATKFMEAPFTNIVGTIFEAVSYVIFYLSGIFLVAASKLLDIAIDQTIKTGLINNLYAVNAGWTIIRDICNLLFVFVLLYIAISTILDLGGRATKQLLATVIIAALLINFSMFFSKVVIDFGNIMAVQFWNKMQMVNANVTSPTAAKWLLEGSQIQTTLDPRKSVGGDKLPYTMVVAIYLFGSILMLVLGYAFIAGAVMMAIRLVTLIMLVIFSPFAFISLALPKYNYFDKWFGKLVSESLAAPVFLIMMYITTQLVSSSDLVAITGTASGSFAQAIPGLSPTAYAIFFNYLIVVILILTALEVTSNFSSKGMALGTKAAKWATGGYIGGGLGIAGMVGRQTFGRAGQYAKFGKEKEAALREQARKGGFTGAVANMRLATNEKITKGLKNSTFDARNSGFLSKGLGMAGVDAGKGSTKSFEKTGAAGASIMAMTGADKTILGKMGASSYRGSENEKEALEKLKERYKYDPAAFEAQAKSKFGAEYDKRIKSDSKGDVETMRKNVIEKAKGLYYDDPIAQIKYIEENSGTVKVNGVDVKYIDTKEGKEAIAKVRQDAIERLEMLHPGNKAAQKAEAQRILGTEKYMEKVVRVDSLGNPVLNSAGETQYDEVEKDRVVYDKNPGVKDARTKLDKQVSAEATQRTVKGSLDVLNILPASGGTDTQQAMRDAAKARFETSIKNSSPDDIAELSKDQLENEIVGKNITPAQMRAVAAKDSVGAGTIKAIHDNILKAARDHLHSGNTTDPRNSIPGLAQILEARPDSKWNIDRNAVNSLKEEYRVTPNAFNL